MSSKDEIKVSVCVVTYNQEKYIAECLQSLVDQETDFPFEIIVGEDCSTDNTRAIVEKYARKYPDLIVRNYHKKNVGAVKNAITSYKMARGKYICHVDGDDYALPGKLKAQSYYLDDHDMCRIVWSRSKVFDSINNVILNDLLNNLDLREWKFTRNDLILSGSVACHSSKMFRKEVLDDLYIPDEEFLDFYLDVMQVGRGYGYILQDFYCVYRSGVGVTGSGKTKEIFLNDVVRLCELYPECNAYASAQFLKIFFVEAKKLKLNVRAFYLFLRSFRIRTPILFFRSIKTIYVFRSPV